MINEAPIPLFYWGEEGILKGEVFKVVPIGHVRCVGFSTWSVKVGHDRTLDIRLSRGMQNNLNVAREDALVSHAKYLEPKFVLFELIVYIGKPAPPIEGFTPKWSIPPNGPYPQMVQPYPVSHPELMLPSSGASSRVLWGLYTGSHNSTAKRILKKISP